MVRSVTRPYEEAPDVVCMHTRERDARARRTGAGASVGVGVSVSTRAMRDARGMSPRAQA
jgi:hypothetical protein